MTSGSLSSSYYYMVTERAELLSTHMTPPQLLEIMGETLKGAGGATNSV